MPGCCACPTTASRRTNSIPRSQNSKETCARVTSRRSWKRFDVSCPNISPVRKAPDYSTPRRPEDMKRKIAVITTSRADYSHLYWPLRDLSAREDVDLRLIALGSHLSPEFGHTIQEIEKDGFNIDARVECLLSSDSDVGRAKTIDLATLSLSDLLGQMS